MPAAACSAGSAGAAGRGARATRPAGAWVRGRISEGVGHRDRVDSTLGVYEFLILVPERYETRVRYYGAYATRRRVWWRRRGVVLVAAPAAETGASERAGDWPALRARKRRWAELLRLVFKIEVEVCPRCGGAMSIVAFITEPPGVRRILAHLDRRGSDARAGPWADVAAAPG